MATLGRWLFDGWRWWIDELLGLMPQRWRRPASDGMPRWLAADGVLVPGDPAPRPIERYRGRAVAIVVAAADCLVRQVERPTVRDRDLWRMLTLDGDRLLPFPGGAMVVGGRIVAEGSQPGRSIVEVAGLPIDRAVEVAAMAAAAGVVAAQVVMAGEPRSGRPIDFAPAMRAAGILPKHRSAAAILWGLVALLAVVNVAVAIWRDIDRLDGFEAIVAEQQPAVGVARTIARRIAQDRALVDRTVALRRRNDALGVLGDTARILPAGAWVQRYVWDGATLRLAGYQRGSGDVTRALRRSGRFAEVRAGSADSQAETALGTPLDITARVVR